MDLSTGDKCSCNTARRTWVCTRGMPFLCDRGQGPEPLKLRLATCGVDKPQLSSRASGETDERAAVSCWAECPTRIRPSRRSVSFPSRLLSLFRPFLKTILPTRNLRTWKANAHMTEQGQELRGTVWPCDQGGALIGCHDKPYVSIRHISDAQ